MSAARSLVPVSGWVAGNETWAGTSQGTQATSTRANRGKRMPDGGGPGRTWEGLTTGGTRPPCPKSIHEWKRGSPPGGFRRQFPTAPGFIVPPTSSRRNHHAASIRDGTLSPDPGGSTLPLPHARLSRAHRFTVATGAGSRGSRGRQSVAVPGGAAWLTPTHVGGYGVGSDHRFRTRCRPRTPDFPGLPTCHECTWA